MDELAALDPARQAIVLLPLAIVLATCAYTDHRDRKVYNKITYPSLGIGLACHAIVFGLDGFLAGLAAAATVLVVGLLALALRVIGAGDIKLLIVVGAFLGFQGLAEVAFYSVFAGTAGGLVAAVAQGAAMDMLRRLGRWFKGIGKTLYYRTANFYVSLERDERTMVPYAIAILVGGVATWTDAVYGVPGWWEIFARAWTPE